MICCMKYHGCVDNMGVAFSARRRVRLLNCKLFDKIQSIPKSAYGFHNLAEFNLVLVLFNTNYWAPSSWEINF